MVALYYYEHLTLKEIGRALGISESRVSQVHTRAMSRLRLRLQQGAGRRGARREPTPRRTPVAAGAAARGAARAAAGRGRGARGRGPRRGGAARCAPRSRRGGRSSRRGTAGWRRLLGVHHEINNALVGVRGNAQLLLMGPAGAGRRGRGNGWRSCCASRDRIQRGRAPARRAQVRPRGAGPRGRHGVGVPRGLSRRAPGSAAPAPARRAPPRTAAVRASTRTAPAAERRRASRSLWSACEALLSARGRTARARARARPACARRSTATASRCTRVGARRRARAVVRARRLAHPRPATCATA